jgi:hypothetical protein
VYGSSLYLEDRAISSVMNQLEISKIEEKGTAKTNIMGLAKEFIFKPWQLAMSYVDLFILVRRPSILSQYIIHEMMSSKEVAGFIGVSLFVTSVIDSIFGIKSDIKITDISFINNIIINIMNIIYLAFYTLLIYYPMRILGGKANFSQTFTATVIISTVTVPIFSLIIGIGLFSGKISTFQMLGPVYAIIAIPVYGALHQLTWFRTVFVNLILQILMSYVILIILQ